MQEGHSLKLAGSGIFTGSESVVFTGAHMGNGWVAGSSLTERNGGAVRRAGGEPRRVRES